MRIVEWGTSRNVTAFVPTTSTTTGYAQSGTQTARFNATSTSIAPITAHHHCTIQMQVDSSNIIRRYQYDGSWGGCASYIDALKRADTRNETAAQARMRD